jgi:hypothetical protein
MLITDVQAFCASRRQPFCALRSGQGTRGWHGGHGGYHGGLRCAALQAGSSKATAAATDQQALREQQEVSVCAAVRFWCWSELGYAFVQQLC